MTAHHLQPGTKCGAYTIESVLGEGGMGVVYLATDPKGRKRAIKTLRFAQQLKADVAQRFLGEIKALAQIENVHVVRLFDVGQLERPEGTLIWFSLEYLKGRTLRQVIEEQGAQTEPESVARWGRHIAEGVHAAHRRRIIHRDLKPENAALSGDGDTVKVFDLGIAKLKGALHATAVNQRVGTLAYMAPEQVDGGDLTSQADIYALGVILYELATGQHPICPSNDPIPLHEITMRIVAMDPKPILQVRPDFPPDLAAIAERCMRKRPEERFHSMREVSDALEEVLIRLRTERHKESFESLGVPTEDEPPVMPQTTTSSSGSEITVPPVVSERQGSRPSRPSVPAVAEPSYAPTMPLGAANPASPAEPPAAAPSAGPPKWVLALALGLAAALGVGVVLVRKSTTSEDTESVAAPATAPAPAEGRSTAEEEIVDAQNEAKADDHQDEDSATPSTSATPPASAPAAGSAPASKPSSPPPPTTTPRPTWRPPPPPPPPSTKDVLL